MMKQLRLFIPLTIMTMIAICIISCTHTQYDTRRFYASKMGKYLTIWDDYIIFEKYEGKEPPKENYIKLNHDTPYRSLVDVFLKKMILF